jgi:hypothetical protein
MTTGGFGWLWTDRALWQTKDSGATWKAVGFVDPNGARIVVSAALTNPTTGLVLVRDSVHSKIDLEASTDGARTWTTNVTWSF